MMVKRYWQIKGYDSMDEIFSCKVEVGSFPRINHLLQALTAKAGLSYNEMIGSYAKRGTKRANNLLNVHHDGPSRSIMCGSNPHFIARLVVEDDD
jgi:hypothetical protein